MASCSIATRQHAAALGEGAAHQMAGALGRDEEDVHILGRLNLAEVDVEAVGEQQGLALGQMWGLMSFS